MKKWFCVAVAVFSCSLVSADNPEKIETLSSKISLDNKEGYFVLADGSCWKVVGFSKRWRSLSEWWNAVELVPKNYDCIPNDWYLGSPIGVYDKNRNMEVNEADAANQEILHQCSHILVNGRTQQVLFAIAMQPAECLIQLYTDARNEGYNAGYSKGRLSTFQSGTEIYNNGHADGYKAGYADGLRNVVVN